MRVFASFLTWALAIIVCPMAFAQEEVATATGGELEKGPPPNMIAPPPLPENWEAEKAAERAEWKAEKSATSPAIESGAAPLPTPAQMPVSASDPPIAEGATIRGGAKKNGKAVKAVADVETSSVSEPSVEAVQASTTENSEPSVAEDVVQDYVAPKMINFDKPVYTVEQALATSVFGVSLNMTTDQVREALVERGFVEPISQDLPSTGFLCDNPEPSAACNLPGYTQEQTFLWTRGGELEGGGYLEEVLPFFYNDRNGLQRLYSMQYVKRFDAPVSDLNAALQLYTQRLGAPTTFQSLSDEVQAAYLVMADIPTGFTPTPVDNRMPSQVTIQRAVTATRTSCHTQTVAGSAPAAECIKVESGDEYAQDVFEALIHASQAVDQSNVYLGVKINHERSRIYLVADFLHQAEVIRNARLAVEPQSLAPAPALIADDL